MNVKEPSYFDPRLRCQQDEMLHLYGSTGMHGMTYAMESVRPCRMVEVVAVEPSSNSFAAPASAAIELSAPTGEPAIVSAITPHCDSEPASDNGSGDAPSTILQDYGDQIDLPGWH
ncbi:hypothetical protein GCM10007320_29810 [Pseudorhodoferax aquiterrae]|uniref:Uncharacterized protein n=1 Tax=Pseudorhodoferax aquiterrae TaxID=747304 RepID=A0ABQ3G364_9BURK|nr:hypothetical protein GCM10007320_29810 [Pseudorhodoferax aquiterrae]